MSYYDRNQTKSAWSFVQTEVEDKNRVELLQNRSEDFNNILFNETHKSKLVESCILKCQAKTDLFSLADPLSNTCLNNCMTQSLNIMKSLDFIQDYVKY